MFAYNEYFDIPTHPDCLFQTLENSCQNRQPVTRLLESQSVTSVTPLWGSFSSWCREHTGHVVFLHFSVLVQALGKCSLFFSKGWASLSGWPDLWKFLSKYLVALTFHFSWGGWQPGAKVIHPKYSKHWLSTVAHTFDCVSDKILNHCLNHGLLFSLFNFLGEKTF